MRIFNLLKKQIKAKKFKDNALIGKNFKIYACSNCFSDNKENIKIGDNCEIAGTLYSMDDGKITIGNYTEIREASFVGSVEDIKIGDYVIISNHVKIYDNNNHPTDPETRKQMCINGFHGEAWRWTYAEHKPVVIENNVWIGEGTTILKGVTIGEGSIIGCNSVVTKDVPPYCIAAGNPAKVVKKLEY